MRRKIAYEHLDVFTKKAFGGNQLAVFPSPGKLSKGQMQHIASEINYSETTFIFPPKAREHDAKVRIFTPTDEIPFAGHPTLGTAFVIANLKKKRTSKKPARLILELGAGEIPVDLEYSGRDVKRVVMHQPVPRFGSALQNRGQAAKALGIKKIDIMGGGVVSNGLDFLIVEVQSLEAVRQARLNIDEAVNVIKRHGVCGIYVFVRLESKKVNVHSRFFAPTLGVIEDPATGSASGAVGGYLARILKFPLELHLGIEQGVEIKRPSFIEVDVRCDKGLVHSVAVAGGVVRAGEGVIFVP
jgi:trans-2,3-dihydro-3-hydroxyanthranilate isomerase